MSNYDDYFLRIQPLLTSAVAKVARRRLLSADEAADLAGEVRLKLMENDYFLLRRFRGHSCLSSYLLAIAYRHLLDARSSLWGRWRPSQVARRHGHIGVDLDRLLTRDRVPFDVAFESLCARHGRRLNRQELFELSLRFPNRTSRRWVGSTALERLPATTEPDALETNADDISTALAAAVERCLPDDRRLIELRFVDGLSIADIARLLRVEQKPLYRRFRSLLAALQARLAQRNVTRYDVLSALGDARRAGISDVLGRTA